MTPKVNLTFDFDLKKIKKKIKKKLKKKIKNEKIKKMTYFMTPKVTVTFVVGLT